MREETQEAPPIGLMPRYIWDAKRMNEIEAAMERFIQARKRIPIDWLDEYIELQNRAK